MITVEFFNMTTVTYLHSVNYIYDIQNLHCVVIFTLRQHNDRLLLAMSSVCKQYELHLLRIRNSSVQYMATGDTGNISCPNTQQ